MAVNLRSVYLLCRGCLPYLTAAGRSAIVNVASIQGSRGFSGYPGYAATKAGDPNEHSTPNEISENSFAERFGLRLLRWSQEKFVRAGILGFTRQIAVDYATRGIRVNAVSPGPVTTDLGRTSVENEPDFPPLGPAGSVRPLAGLPCLCSLKGEVEQDWALCCAQP